MLTKRQIEVCKSFVKSRGIDIINFISQELFISRRTVNTHITDIYQKLLVNSHAQLMYYLLSRKISHMEDIQNKL